MAATLLSLVLAALALSGCTDFSEQGSNRLAIMAIDVAAPRVATGTMVLAVNVTLDNSGGPSGDVTVLVKAYDMATGLLAIVGQAPVGTIPQDTSRAVEVALDLPRAPGYRMDVVVLQDGQVHQTRQVTATNLDRLTPNLHGGDLGITDIEFQVLGVQEGRVAIRATVYLTNEGATASEALRLQVKAQEVATGLLADEAWLDITPLGPEETHPFPAGLEVPDDFNYDVEAVLWKGSVILERGTGHVQLLPREARPTDEAVVVTNPDVSVFAEGGNAFNRGEAAYSDHSADTPAAGAVALAAAALGLAAWRRRR